MSVRVISQVFDRSIHSGTDLLMLVVLADYSDDEGNSYPAVASLARKCRMKPRNANYILKALQESGELRVLKNEGPRGTNRYRIMLAQLGTSKPLQRVAPLQSTAPLQHGALTPATHCAKPLQPIADEPSLNRQEPLGQQKSKIPACPYDAIRDLFHETLPELPKARLMGNDRKKVIGDFWKWIFTESKSDGRPRAENAEQALEWISAYLARARDNDFIMGRTARSAEHANWNADLDYVVSLKGRKQVIEKTGGAS